MNKISVSAVKWIAVIVLAAAVCVPCGAYAKSRDVVEIRLSSASARRGEDVSVDVIMAYRGENKAAAFNFDLNYDPSILQNPSVTAQDSLTDVGKHFVSNIVSPGVFRVLVFGINRELIPSGKIGTFSFRIKTDAAKKNSALIINNVSVASPSGKADLKVSCRDGSVRVVK